jgi:glycosyltransferase involved in cell wall biosynthesis
MTKNIKSNPEISICIPVLNTVKYLDERIESIEKQTFQDYEVVIIDGFSTDGSWEKICEYAERDSRVKAYQEPPKGVYDAFNKVALKAKGDFIYIATSDDTASPNLLEELHGLLIKNPNCDIAQCSLQIIGPKGELDPNGDYWEVRPGMKFLGEWLNQYHTRTAPYDCLLGLVFNTIYTSMTQILCRRKVFESCEKFPENYGSFGDHHWHLQASLMYNVVYSPKKLATWRKYHDGQASDPKKHFNFRKNFGRHKMAQNAIKNSPASAKKNLLQINRCILKDFYLLDAMHLNLIKRSKAKFFSLSVLYFFKHLIFKPTLAAFILRSPLIKRPSLDYIFTELSSEIKYNKIIKPIKHV